MFQLEGAGSPQVDVVADCHALQVGELRLQAGQRRVFETLASPTAFVFHQGTGTMQIAGCSHAIAAGTVELVCPGEPCTICAVQDVHAFLVTVKDEEAAR